LRQAMEQWILVMRFIKEVFPKVEQALAKWRERAERIPDQELRRQALASIHMKRFHCQGGSIYALYPGVNQDLMVRFIVAFQTISDYLDNLCDRAGCEEEKSFRQLHLAMTEALSPELPLSDYYAYYPYRNDGGYLTSLVEECRACLSHFISYRLVRKEAVALVSLYNSLQSLKHLGVDRREEKMVAWASPCVTDYPDISVWEFGAACGSTLGVFVLCGAACAADLTEEDVRKIKTAYFPYLCGLHILLDYFIDQAEDRREGDLNFFFYYHDPGQMKERLAYFLHQSLTKAGMLEHASFHTAVIAGMVSLYLSDPKTSEAWLKGTARTLIRKTGKTCTGWYLICKLLRRKKII